MRFALRTVTCWGKSADAMVEKGLSLGFLCSSFFLLSIPCFGGEDSKGYWSASTLSGGDVEQSSLKIWKHL